MYNFIVPLEVEDEKKKLNQKKIDKITNLVTYITILIFTILQVLEQLTLIEERNRLSREMHDSIGHHLVSVSLQLEILKKIIKEKPDDALKIIETLKKEISDSIQELRDVVKTLRKPYEFDIPIEESIKNLIEN